MSKECIFKSFQDLNIIHIHMENIFYQHQLCVLNGNRTQALNFFNAYFAFIKKHIAEEEEWLFPLYEEIGKSIRGGSVKIFLGEHQKILQFLDKINGLLNSWLQFNVHDQNTLNVLDIEYRCRELIEHHSVREDHFLFPELDRIISSNQKHDILSQFSLPLLNLSE
jgi:hemerythrin-like domain-containing protein